LAEDPRGIRKAIFESPTISTDGLKVLENLPNVFNTIPERSPFRTSLSQQLFEGLLVLVFFKILISSTYVSDLLSVSPQAARNYNQSEVEPVNYYLSSLVCI
jgi:hypothetical protein